MIDELLKTKPLQLGQILSNGGMVLHFKWREHRTGEMEGQHGVVICFLKENPYDPFVVWRFVKYTEDTLILNKRGAVDCMHGEYVQNIESALRHYNARKL